MPGGNGVGSTESGGAQCDGSSVENASVGC